jgi:type I restriction enzyme M protein
MFFKRLCDQWEHEADEAIADLERQQGRRFTEQQKAVFRAREGHRFSIPQEAYAGRTLNLANGHMPSGGRDRPMREIG